MGKGEYVMLEFWFFIVSLLLVIVSVRLYEATSELKRLRSEDRMQATLGELLDSLDAKK